MNFREADRRYVDLKRQHDNGNLSAEEFDAQLEQMMVQDDEGHWWAKSRKTGEWYYYDGSTWVRDTQPGYEETRTVRERPPVQEPPSSSMTASLGPEQATVIEDVRPERQNGWKRKVVLGTVAATVAGVAWLVLGLSGLLPNISYLGLYTIASIGMLVGLVSLHTLQATSYGRQGLAGFLASFVGIILLLIAAAVRILSFEGLITNDLPGIYDFILLLGSFGALVGLALLGVTTLRARVLPQRYGWLLFIVDVSLFVHYAPEILFELGIADFNVYVGHGYYDLVDTIIGLTWLALGYVLWAQRGITPDHRS